MHDFTIHEDELELNRILLERNLQMHHTDTSFRLSSVDGDDEDNELEYARHNSAPSPEFVSYNLRDRDPYADDATHSQLHAWSYRTGEDDEGIYPYGAESVSTTNHHASGVTLTAGLAGPRSRRGADASLSGAEYDPERPIDAMIAGAEKLSMFDTTEASKSKFSNITFDPLVVDNTAELDRVLQSGYQPPPSLRSRDKSTSQHSRSVRLRSPPHSSATSSDSENNDVNLDDSRPKLTDALRRVSFSPKRPRSPNATPSHLPRGNISVHRRQPSSPLARVTTNADSPSLTQDVPTPRPIRRAASSSSAQPTHPIEPLTRAASQPQVRLHPATPSSSSLAKSIRGKLNETKREGTGKVRHRIHEDGHDREEESFARLPSAPPVSRHVPNHRQATPLRKSSLKMSAGTPRFGKVHLPDVTGLTSAVESPAKMALADGNYMSMTSLRADETVAREVEARLIKTLNTVQSRLEHLEEENSISRRRVRELEYELEECKREVIKERTRLLEETAELSGVIQAANIARALGRKTAKGKGKSKESTSAAANLSTAEERYRGVVEEKKALETLITSLRTHLTRLTSELSEHQAMLMELRSLREEDAVALRDKLTEVDNLKNEVERLAGEVEVLRGVVEEGLRERRRPGNEVSVDALVGPEDRAISVDENDEPVPAAIVDTEEESDGVSDLEESRLDGNGNAATNDEDPWSIDGSSRTNTTPNPNNTDVYNDNDAPAGISRADRTIRTDRASLGSSVPVLGLSTVSTGSAFTTRTNAARANTSVGGGDESNMIVGEEERNRIEAEIEERRSFRNSFETSRLSISPRPKLTSPTLQRNTAKGRHAILKDVNSDGEREMVDLGRETRARPPPATPTSHSQLPPRAPAPTPYHAISGPDVDMRQQRQENSRRNRQVSAESHRSSGKDGARIPETPFPQIRGEYLERLFFSAPEHDARTCMACTRRKRPANAHTLKGERYNRETERCADDTGGDVNEEDDSISQLLPSRYDRFLKSRKGKQKVQDQAPQRKEADDEGLADGSSEDSPVDRAGPSRNGRGKQRTVGFEEVREMAKTAGESGLPPQTVVTRVIRELEDDFTHYKSIYCELADRYKEMDAVSEVRRRNILAQHLKEVVDILEQKGDQIASLYDLLSFKDKPVSESAAPRSWGRNSLWSKRL
ncbi:hypothetical protein AX15_001029 [Amanita polypyramis BW_CC]|nr:hypothetical protein AX15_001029 [Amanita polypyramis BW_CC]